MIGRITSVEIVLSEAAAQQRPPECSRSGGKIEPCRNDAVPSKTGIQQSLAKSESGPGRNRADVRVEEIGNRLQTSVWVKDF